MFHIFNVIKDGLPTISLQNSDTSTAATINLEPGGRLQELTLLGKSIITLEAAYGLSVFAMYAVR